MLQGVFLLSSAAVIIANFVADILLRLPRPARARRLMATDRPAHRPPAQRRRARRGTATQARRVAKTWASKPGRAGLGDPDLLHGDGAHRRRGSRRRTRRADVPPARSWRRRAPSTGSAPTTTAPTCSRGFLLGSRISIAGRLRGRASSPASSAPSSASRPGYYGGWIDKVLTAIDDWFLVIPFLPFAIVVATALGRVADDWPVGRVTLLIIVIGILSLGRHVAHRAQPGAVREGAPVHRAREGAGRLAAAGSCASTSCPTCCRWCSPTRC